MKKSVFITFLLMSALMIMSFSYVSAQTIGGAEVSRYTFEADTVDGNELKDVWGNNNGTINGGIVNPGNRSGSDVMSFSYQDNVTVGGFYEGADNRGLTVMSRVRIKSSFPGPEFVTKRAGNVNYYDLGSLSPSSSNNVTFLFRNKSGREFRLHGNTSLDKKTWHHVAATWDGDQMAVYLDGKKDSIMHVGTTIKSLKSPLYLGKRLNGSLDDVRIYNASLSRSTINSIYNGGDPSGKLKKTWVYDGDEDGYHKNGSLRQHSSSSPQPKEKWIKLVNSKGKDYCDNIDGYHSRANDDCYSGEVSSFTGAKCSEDSDCNSLYKKPERDPEYIKKWHEALICNDDNLCELNTTSGKNVGIASPRNIYSGTCSLKGYDNITDYNSDFTKSQGSCSTYDFYRIKHGNSNCQRTPQKGLQLDPNFTCDYGNQGVIGDRVADLRDVFEINISGKKLNHSKNYTNSGLKQISLSKGLSKVEFSHDFYEGHINVNNYSVRSDSFKNRSYFEVSGVGSSNKSIYLARSKKTDRVCLKDSEKTDKFFDDFSPTSSSDKGGLDNCTGKNEYVLECPGQKSGYNCNITSNGSRYKIYPLDHSAVAEYVTNDSGGGTTNNSCTESDWNCTPSDWSNASCQEGQKNRSCVKKSNVSCSGGYQPNETVSCGIETLPKCEIDNHYECTVWSDCHKSGDLEGKQKRNCKKIKDCRNYDPKEKRDCEVEESSSSDEENTNESDFPWTIIIIGAGVILLGLVVLLIIKKTSSSSPSSSKKGGSGNSSSGPNDNGGSPVNVGSSSSQNALPMNPQKKQMKSKRTAQQKRPSRQQAQPPKKKVASQRRNLAPNRNPRARRQPKQANNMRRTGRGRQNR